MFPFANNQAWPGTPGNPFAYQTNQVPYQSIQFLNEAFNYNQQSIAAYETLTHEMKLQFYLSVQQMKLLGYMENKAQYQNILQQIARRKMILKKPQQTTVKSSNNNDWGVKLDNILDGHLKKLQKDNFLDDIPVALNTNHRMPTKQVDFLSGQPQINKKKQNEDDQQFEWAESAQSPSATNNQVFSNLNGLVFTQDMKNQRMTKSLDYHLQENQNQLNNAPISFDDLMKKQQKGSNFNRSQSSNKQIPAKAQIIDVWDLQVIEDQPKSLKKLSNKKLSNKNDEAAELQAYFNKPTPIVEQPQIIQNNSIPIKPTPNFNNLPTENQQNKIIEQLRNNNIKNVGKQNEYQDVEISHFTPNATTDIFNGYNYSVQNNSTINPIVSHKQIPHQINQQVVQSNNNENKQRKISNEDQFEWQQSTDNPSSTKPQNIQVNNPKQITQNNIFNIDSTPTLVNTNQPLIQQQYDFNFLQQPTSNRTYQNTTITPTAPIFQSQPTTSIPSYSQPLKLPVTTASSNFGLDVNSIDSSFTFANPHLRQQSVYQNTSSINISTIQGFKRKSNGQLYLNQQQQQQNQQNNNNQQITNSNIIAHIDTHVLQPLKCFPPTKKILSILKNKIFDFDRKFYNQTLNLIQSLGYQNNNNNDYKFVKQQSQICNQIYRLTQLYTAAVDQQKQDQLIQTLKQSKILYNKLDTKKTANIARKYLKYQGKTLSYQIGKLSLLGGVPSNLIQKIINNNNNNNNNNNKFNQIITVLYLIVYLSNIFSFGTFACQVIEYIQYIINQMQKIAHQTSGMNPQCIKLIKQSQQFNKYRNNITKLAITAKRILQLSILCTKDQVHPQIQQILKTLSTLTLTHEKIQQKQKQKQLIPNNYIVFFSNIACSNCNNIYTLHSKMNQFIQKYPICCICLNNIQITNNNNNKDGDKYNDNKYYHYGCWNFKETVRIWKQKRLQQQNKKLEEENNIVNHQHNENNGSEKVGGLQNGENK